MVSAINTTNTNEVLDQAVTYATEFGIPVFPCSPATKAPLNEHGFIDATIDASQIRAWWARQPNAMIGLSVGAAGYVVLDLDRGDDGEPDGFDWLAEYEKKHGPLPVTLSATTPSGGEHYYFTVPDGETIFSSNGGIAPHVDIKSTGGYVVCAPSVNRDGGRYEWQDETATAAPLPAALAEIMRAASSRSSSGASASSWRRLTDEDRAQLHPATAHALGLLEQLGGHSPILKVAPDREPWVEIIRPAKIGGNSASIGYIGPGIAKLFTGNWPRLAEGVYDADDLADIVSPADNATVPPFAEVDNQPQLDQAALHGLAGDIVNGLAPETEAHPAALLIGFLTMFGNAANKAPHVRIGGDQHAARINAAIVGRTARARKGTAASLIREVMVRADIGWSSRIVGGFGSGESLVDAVRDATDDDPGPGDNRLMVREPELARILNVAERDGSTLSMVVREAWDGTRLAVRSRKSTVTATGAHISVMADITSDELRRTLTNTQVANGFGNRFLFVLVHRAQKLPSGGNLDDATLTDLGDRVAAALEKARAVQQMRRTPAAEQAWIDVYNAIPDDDTGLFGSIVARAEAHILRLSVAYALLDGSKDIEVDHLRAACAVWDYCRASALVIFGELTGNPIADRLHAALEAAGDQGLDGKEQHALFSGHATAAKVNDARVLLEAKGLAVTEAEPTKGRPKIRTRIAKEANQANKAHRLLDLPSLHSLSSQPAGEKS